MNKWDEGFPFEYPKPKNDYERDCNIFGREIAIKINQCKCEHIYGFIRGMDVADGWIAECTEELNDPNLDIAFTYCPKCGKRLIDE